MATLKQPLKFEDIIMNKVTKKEFYMVLFEDLHKVWVIELSGKEPPKQLAKHMINMAYIKVNRETAKVLYGDSNEKTEEIK